MSLSLFHHIAVLLLAEKCCDLACEPSCGLLYALAVSEEVSHMLKLQLSLVVACLSLFQSHVGDEDKLLTEIVEGDDLVKEHEVNVLEVLRIAYIGAEGLFRIGEEIVGEISCQTACEGGKIVEFRAPVF